MNNPTPQHVLRRCAGGRADRRGTAIILVLVSMVLLAILAGSLLQLARFERIPRSESNIEVVIESVIAEILNQATDDLLDDDGHFLNTQFTSIDYGDGDEPWDFPWTNTQHFGKEAERLDGSTDPVFGGRMDDSWLAWPMPDFRAGVPGDSIYDGFNMNATTGMWRKITNLTGLYLGGDGTGTADLTQSAEPEEFPVNSNASHLNRDMNISVVQPTLVDADGDGIGDSRWEWAPLRQVGATQYVMAVRIIDLSSRMDANIAMGVSDATYGDRRPFGDSPVELDASGYISDLAGTAGAGLVLGTVQGEWERVLRYRLENDGSSAYGSIPSYDNNLANPPAGTRRDYWNDSASRVSNTFGRNGEVPGGGFDYSASFNMTDAFELLQGNGLNSTNTTTIENQLVELLRSGDGQENGYAAGAGTPPNSWSQKQFWELDPRKHITTVSGSSSAVKPGSLAVDRELKMDVNLAVQTAGGRDDLRDRIREFMDNSNGGALLAEFPYLPTAQNFANQMTANISDYIDDDNLLTISGNYTGFEALPYITEVYIQKPYEVDSVTVDAIDGSKDVEWRGLGSTAGYAIEIGNPFGRYNAGWTGRPVSLENIWLKLGSTAEVLLSSLAGMPAELAPGEVVIVTYDSIDTNGDSTGDNVIANLLATVTQGNVTTTPVAAEVAGTTAMPNGSVTVALHAEDQDSPGSALGWAYSACQAQVATGPITENLPDDGSTEFTNIAPGDTTFIQTNYRGIGQGLRMMMVHPDPQSSNTRGFAESIDSLANPSLNRNDASGTAELTNVTPEFTNEAKTGASTVFPAALDDQQIVLPDSERGRLHWIGDLLQMPVFGPDFTATGVETTMAAAFETAGMATSTDGISDLLLPYQRVSGTSVAPVIDGTAGSGAFNYPHAVLLLEQLTTFNPATDGEDGANNGDPNGNPESLTNEDLDEVLVPGRLNLNTASQDTLTRLLPFPDLATRAAIAEAIVNRRENARQNTGGTDSYGTGQNDIPGIAYTTALYEQLATLANGPVPLPDGTTIAYTNTSTDGGDTTTLGGSQIDLNDYEDPLGTYVPADGVIDDREEEIMLAKWLNEVADTRSDVFAAYIVVQGYPVGDFTGGASESARLIIIFSRANVDGSGDKAVEIGRFRIN